MPATFASPQDDLDSWPQWIRANARNSPDHPFMVYGDEQSEPKVLTWLKAAQGFARATRVIDSLRDPNHEGKTPEIFGILANLDSLTYFTLAAGIAMSGCTAFLISPRNSPAAVAHLLKKTGTYKLFVSDDEQMQRIACISLEAALKDDHNVNVLSAPVFRDFYPEDAQEEEFEELPNFPSDSPAFITHSSGSTAFPKPIPMSHKKLVEIGKSRYIIVPNPPRTNISIHQLPVFHAIAVYLLLTSTHSGATLSCFPPQNPPIMPTPQKVIDAATECECTMLMTVPIFLEMWSRSEENVEKLKRFETAMFSGGPLNKQIGDELTNKGVHITTFYGASEIGVGSSVILEGTTNPEWEYFCGRTNVHIELVPQEGDSNTFELVYECPSFEPEVVNTAVDGKKAYATNDLVRLHPKDSTRFKIYGRKDDQLMLSTGEKTNPGPLEAIICRHPFVKAAVMFGRGRIQNGILVQPEKEHEFDPTDEGALAKFRNDIWPSVEDANAYAPSHSRLYKEMIIVTHPTKPFELTAKLHPRRHVVVKDYTHEVDAVYAAAEASAQTGILLPAVWTSEEVQRFVRETVRHVVRAEVGDDDDIFIRGADSLNATYIRNSLLHALRQANKEPKDGISQDFVYSNPSISRLSTQLCTIVGLMSTITGDGAVAKLQEIDTMIAEFSVDFPQHQQSRSERAPTAGEVVLLTGTTGALGVQILAHLVSMSEIFHIYALNRGGQKSLRDRQLDALVERGLDVEIINSPKVTLVEGDTSNEGFGIEVSMFEKIRDSVTVIIHNAWRVNFNLALESFRPMVRGVRNLIDLALYSPLPEPPRIIFTGSISVFQNRKEPGRPLEASIEDPKWVLGGGYGESKFVAERILERAATSTTLQPIIVRIGQMTSNASGAWNSSDWLPAIVRSGQVLGALPARDDTVSWIGMDVAAQALVDFRNSTSQYLHLAHPNPTPWNTIFAAFSESLHVRLVTWSEWLLRLEKDGTDPASNPAVHLIDFFRAAAPRTMEDMEAPGLPLLDLTQALTSSPTLASPSLLPLRTGDAEGWIRYWKNKGFLSY